MARGKGGKQPHNQRARANGRAVQHGALASTRQPGGGAIVPCKRSSNHSQQPNRRRAPSRAKVAPDRLSYGAWRPLDGSQQLSRRYTTSATWFTQVGPGARTAHISTPGLRDPAVLQGCLLGRGDVRKRMQLSRQPCGPLDRPPAPRVTPAVTPTVVGRLGRVHHATPCCSRAEVTWIFVVATAVAVFVAYGKRSTCMRSRAQRCMHGAVLTASRLRAGIGANDLANSFGTSVGAGALSSEWLRQRRNLLLQLHMSVFPRQCPPLAWCTCAPACCPSAAHSRSHCAAVPSQPWPAVRQALAIAALCEFGGAVLMGSGVTETIRDQVADLSYFVNKPDMCAALDFDMMSLGLQVQAGMPLGTRGNCTGGCRTLM